AALTISTDKPGTSAANTLALLTNVVPGDSATRTVTITNAGSAGFSYIGSASAVANTVLWSGASGLQVTVSRGATTLYSGPLRSLALAASPPIGPGGTDVLTYLFSLPVAADNSYQALPPDFTITYTATQLAGTAR